MTDQMIPLVKRDEEIEASSRMKCRMSIAPTDCSASIRLDCAAAIAFITGDASQLGHFAAILPGILLQSAYSRPSSSRRRRCGCSAATGWASAGTAGRSAERMEKKVCGHDGGCGPNWLGSIRHAERAARCVILTDGRGGFFINRSATCIKIAMLDTQELVLRHLESKDIFPLGA